MPKQRQAHPPHSKQPLAYNDLEFLESPDARPIRLLAEYLEPARRFRLENIQDTVVFFGSARVHSREAAEQALQLLQKKRGRRTADHAMLLKRSRKAIKWSRYYEEARELAGRLTTWSMSLEDPHRRFVVTSGGGPGIMEAANRGALEAGGLSIGLNIQLPQLQTPNRYLTPGLSLSFRYFALRKLHFMLRARAMVAFPGGFGTFDEMFEALTLVQTRKVKPMPVVLVGRKWWQRAVEFDFLVAEGVIARRDAKLFRFADTAAEIWDAVSPSLGSPSSASRLRRG